MGSNMQAVPLGSTKVSVHTGGTVWSVGGLVVGIIASARMWTLVPGALERFAFGSCPVSASQVQLSWTQIAVVAVGGIAAIVLAEFGMRRDGNRWASMIASVIGVSCLIGSAALGAALLATPVSC